MCGIVGFNRLTYKLQSMLENNCYVGYGSNGRRYAERYHDIIKIAAEYKSIFARLAGR